MFNSIPPWRGRYNLSLRDHRKILAVDDAIAFTGGLNIKLDYASTIGAPISAAASCSTSRGCSGARG